jgi:hypothetical protein
MAKIISVGKTPKSAYKPERKVSGLLDAQVQNVRQVIYRKFGEKMGGRPRTEEAASKFLAKATARLQVIPPADLRVPAAVALPVPPAYTPPPKPQKPRRRTAAKRKRRSARAARGKRR